VYMGISVHVVDALAAILVFASIWRVLRYRELLYTCDVEIRMVYDVHLSFRAAVFNDPANYAPSSPSH